MMRFAFWVIIFTTLVASGCSHSNGRLGALQEPACSTVSGKALADRSESKQEVMDEDGRQKQAAVGADGRQSGDRVERGLVGQDDADFDLLEGELDEQAIKITDPLEPFNRMTYKINDTLYIWVLEPVARTYGNVIPEQARAGINNFFENLLTPARLANCLLQGKGPAAGTEFDRFVINTTFGILGFADPAQKKYGLEQVNEDLGQSLAAAGIGNGFYLVLPVLGPSSLRDTAGVIGDHFLNPIRYVKPWELSIGISALKFTNAYSFHVGDYEAFKSAALDPYVAMRQAYVQYRSKQIEK